MIRLPRLSHLQFLVLGHLLAGPAAGREIRERLRHFGFRKSGPGFYQMMVRMEGAGLVTGWYEQHVIDGQIIRERHYQLSAVGRRAWEASREFYRRAIDEFRVPNVAES